MHDFVYQISLQPIVQDDYLQEHDFYEQPFLTNIADYVRENIEPMSHIEALKTMLENRHVAKFKDDLSCFVLLPDAKKNYFANRFGGFKEATLELEQISEADFYYDFDEIDSKIHNLQRAFCNDFASYVALNKYDIMPLDQFIRDGLIGEEYYLGAVIDYHW